MRKLIFLLVTLTFYDVTMANSFSQDTLSQKQLLKMYAKLDSIFEANVRDNNDTYMKKVKAIKNGMVTAGTIETLLSQSNLILSYTSFASIVGKINNPTASGVVGSSFVDFIIQKAGDKLIPDYPDDTLKIRPANFIPAKSRFKNFMSSLVQNPVFKSLLATTPITGVISSILQQAASFEPNRELSFEISTAQIRAAAAKNSKSPVPVKQFISNNLGTGYNNAMLDEFFNEIKPRIEFYDKFNNLADSLDKLIAEKKVERIAIIRQSQTSLTAICRILNIRKNYFVTDLDSLLSTKTPNLWAVSNEFSRAVEMSERASFQLPQVRDFHEDVVKLSVTYIDGYVKILQGYLGQSNRQRALDAGLNQENISTTLAALKLISKEVNMYTLPN
jgi:hypothetical protein